MATERARFTLRQPRMNASEAKNVTAALHAMWTHEKFATDWTAQLVLNPWRHFMLRILGWYNAVRARLRKLRDQLYVKITLLLVVSRFHIVVSVAPVADVITSSANRLREIVVVRRSCGHFCALLVLLPSRFVLW